MFEHLRHELRTRLRLERTGLIYPSQRDAKVVVVRERGADEVLQRRILEHAPPRQVREGIRRRRFRTFAERDRRVDGGSLVVRANGAAGQSQECAQPNYAARGGHCVVFVG